MLIPCVSKCAGPLLHMFQACHPLVKSDVQTALFLLPYLVLTAISQPNGQGKERVREEICHVLREGRTSQEGELCVTAVFSLLDTLKKWVEERKAAVPGGALRQPCDSVHVLVIVPLETKYPGNKRTCHQVHHPILTVHCCRCDAKDGDILAVSENYY